MNRHLSRLRAQTLAHAAALAGLILAGFLLVVCAHPRYLPGMALNDEKLLARLKEQLRQTYPAQFELSGRVSLEARGKQWDYLGFFSRKAPDTRRFVVSGEMGGKVLDVYETDGQPQVLKKPVWLPGKPLAENVLRNLRHLFDWTNLDGASLVRQPGPTYGVVVPLSPGRLKEYLFDADGRLIQSTVSEGGTLQSRARYLELRKLKGWSRPVPVRVEFEDLRAHYKLKIEALQLHPLAADADLLKGQP